MLRPDQAFASALPARGASNRLRQTKHARTLPRRCLHGVHQGLRILRSHGLRFASALPARGASAGDLGPVLAQDLCLGAACTGCIPTPSGSTTGTRSLPRRCLHGVHRRQKQRAINANALCLGAACTGCILSRPIHRRCKIIFASALPARGASQWFQSTKLSRCLCLGAACTGCIYTEMKSMRAISSLPRRCLHGVHLYLSRDGAFFVPLPRRCLHGVHQTLSRWKTTRSALPRRCLHGVHLHKQAVEMIGEHFASALPARGASNPSRSLGRTGSLCLGAACTGCIFPTDQSAHFFISLPRRCLHGVHHDTSRIKSPVCPLPRRCLHGVHRKAVDRVINLIPLPRRCLHGVHQDCLDQVV